MLHQILEEIKLKVSILSMCEFLNVLQGFLKTPYSRAV